MTRIDIGKIGPAITSTLNDLAKKNKALVGRKAADLPRRFLKAADAFYFSVLRVRTGRLRQSFEPVGQNIQEGRFTAGLRSRVEYATIQHQGGTIPPHVIRPKFKKALFWPGAEHPVKKVNHPGGTIRPKFFFKIPMIAETEKMITELKKEIGFK